MTTSPAAHRRPARLDRVVVTGVGAVTPHGVGAATLFDGLLAGRSTARHISKFDPSAHPVRIACEVPGFDPDTHLPRKLVRQLDPFAQYAVVAGQEALTQAGLLAAAGGAEAELLPLADGLEPDRVGVIIASSVGGIGEMTGQHERLVRRGPRSVRPYLSIAMPLNMGSGQLAIRHGLRGPSYAVVSACASAADAIGAALDLLRLGRADVVVAGGAEAAVNPLTVAGFGAAGALSRRNHEPERASRPFDLDRDGFVMGDGAAALVLERAEHAAARGVPALAELAGYGATNDAHHPSQPAPGGEGAARALRAALHDADAHPLEVDHINAHGTSTPLNDRAEAQAIRAVFGAHTDRIAVTSTKSSIGHLLGAAGAAEAVATVLTARAGRVPPTINLDRPDPTCDLDIVSGAPRPAPAAVACSNSFGFGGHNAVLVFRAA